MPAGRHFISSGDAPDVRIRQVAPNAIDKVALVPGSLEADNVVLKQPAKDLYPPGQDFEDIRRRERNVMKIGQIAQSSFRLDETRNQHQVIIVDPDKIVR